MKVIDTNLDKLRSCDFNQLTKRVNIHEGSDGECIQYLFLMANKESGEIVDITKRQKFYENTISAYLSVTRTSLLEETPYQLQLSQPEEIPGSIQKIIKTSLEKFNTELREEFNKK